jgi:glycosyltransferase involved in cell wall biosynthesis
MKILFINRHLPPEFESSLIRIMEQTAFELIKRNHEIHFLGLTENLDISEINPSVFNGIICHRIYLPRCNKLRYNYEFNILAKKKLEQLCERYKYDLINIHESRLPHLILRSKKFKKIPCFFNFYASVAWEFKFDFKKKLNIFLKAKKSLLNIKELFSLFKSFVIYIPNYFWLRYCEKYALKRATEVHAASNFVKNQILQFYGKKYEKKIRIIPYATDYETFSKDNTDKEIIQRIKSNNPGIIIFCLRRLVFRMGLEQLLQAVSLLRQKRNDLNFSLLIGGQGPLELYLKSLSKHLQIEDMINFTGFISEEDLPSYYQAADLFVLPSEELEGFGLVILESMAMGVPVIGSTAGAIPEILFDAPGAYVFKRNDIIDLSSKLETAITEIQSKKIPSPKAIRRYAQNNYNWSIYIDKYLERNTF